MAEYIEREIALEICDKEYKEREHEGCEYCKNNMDLHAEHPHIIDAGDVDEGLEITAHIYKNSLMISVNEIGAKFTVAENIEYCPMCGKRLKNDLDK